MSPQEGEKKPDNVSSAGASNTPNKDEAKPATSETPIENSLEGDQAPPSDNKPNKDEKSAGPSPLKKILAKFDIYLLIFVFVLLIGVIVGYITIQKNKNTPQGTNSAQTLDQNALKQLSGNDTQVGGTNQTLDIQSSTVFAGDVLIKKSLEVAGSLKVAGSLTLPGITVSGTTDLDQVNATNLTLTGAETVKGQLTVNSGLTVNGVASFDGLLNAGVINVSNLNLNGDLQINHHIQSSGGIPKDSGTAALGGGGTTSLNGSDLSGAVNINTGGNPSAGCMVNITFVHNYTSTPYVVISPVGQGSANSGPYYLTKSNSGFSICFTSPPTNTPMTFDYIVMS